MSYDINTFKVKKLKNLRIPYTSFFKSERKDLNKLIVKDGEVRWEDIDI